MDKGTIKKVTVKDFVTYSYASINPGPNLNIIVGPNGAGKSTIVSAICLGLGGKPKMMGKTGQISDYIRSGCDKATIEIVLNNPGGNDYTVTRTITKENKSIWALNKASCSYRQIEDLTKELSIQVDNLCQFLPQDRVQDFAKMDQLKLLESTEKTVGSPDMFDNFMKLKELRHKLTELENQVNSSNQRLAEEQKRNESIQKEVEGISEKKNLLETVQQLKQKQAWLRYSRQRNAVEQTKKQRDEAAAELRASHRKYAPMEDKIQEAQRRVRDVQQKSSEAFRESNRMLVSVKENLDREEKVNDSIAHNVQALEMKLEEEKKRKDEVLLVQQRLNKLENDLRSQVAQPEEEIRSKVKNIFGQIEAESKRLNDLQIEKESFRGKRENYSHEEKAYNNELRRLKDVAKHRLEFLQKYNDNAYRAVMWLRENAGRFRGKIYEPIMLEINVSKQEYAKFVETSIPNRDLIAFVCENKEDMNDFLRAVRDQKKLKVNAVHSEPVDINNYKPKYPLDELRKYGFHSYLIDLVSAPLAIMNYLCKMCRFHAVPVGNDKTYKLSDNIIKDLRGMNLFFSTNTQFHVSQSKYSGCLSTRVTEIPEARLLSFCVDRNSVEEIQIKLTALENKKKAILERENHQQLKIQQQEQQIEKLRSHKKELTSVVEQRKTIQARINAMRGKKKDLESEKLDENRERNKVAETNKKLVGQLLGIQKDMQTDFEKVQQALVNHKKYQYVVSIAANQLSKIEAQSRDQKEVCQQLEATLDQVKKELENTRDTAKRLLKLAQDMSGVQNVESLPDKLKKTFSMYTNNLEELENIIIHTQAKADCLVQADEGVIQEYERRKENIASLTVSVEHKTSEIEKIQSKIQTLKEKWLTPLNDLIKRINSNFSNFFQQMGCAGEVSLSTGQHEDDFEHYGLVIRVKFRDNEQLQELTQHHQSGGERTVATAIYMLSLQELTRVPFRCVDEINQGMDATNERRVFELLANVTSRGTAQYFLLTPKLLPDLLYTPSMAVLCVFNGVGVTRRETWNIDTFIDNACGNSLMNGTEVLELND